MADAVKYVFNPDVLDTQVELQKNVITQVDEILTKAKAMKTQIEASDSFQGLQKKELVNFLDLLLRYHEKIMEDGASCKKFQKVLSQLSEDMKSIKDFTSYAELKNI
ncbi:hypothetical protein HCJ32_10325 [Listeria booriae]|uniref:hypothetical protein n=1 Tax=Listeria booriae TaxID=1552123 RepID=UPI001625E8A8|nr:hypothetical protein [Listeria booriae]MBC1945361.1 hypothetical protein [Listeria booriae]